MPRIVVAPAAEADALEIWTYIAKDNATDADRLLDRIDQVFEKLAAHPLMGKAVDALGRNLRFFPLGDYLIFYRPLSKSSSSGQRKTWVNCAVAQGGHSKPIAAIFEGYYKSEIPYKPIALKPVNEFLIRSHAGKLTYQVNGETLFEEQTQPKNTAISEDGHLGFGALRFCGKNTTKIRKIEVRRLTAQ